MAEVWGEGNHGKVVRGWYIKVGEKARRFSHSPNDILENKIVRFLCQMFKTYRLEVCSRFYSQLYILERSNETSLIYILIGKHFTEEIKHHTV